MHRQGPVLHQQELVVPRQGPGLHQPRALVVHQRRRHRLARAAHERNHRHLHCSQLRCPHLQPHLNGGQAVRMLTSHRCLSRSGGSRRSDLCSRLSTAGPSSRQAIWRLRPPSSTRSHASSLRSGYPRRARRCTGCSCARATLGRGRPACVRTRWGRETPTQDGTRRQRQPAL